MRRSVRSETMKQLGIVRSSLEKHATQSRKRVPMRGSVRSEPMQQPGIVKSLLEKHAGDSLPSASSDRAAKTSPELFQRNSPVFLPDHGVAFSYNRTDQALFDEVDAVFAHYLGGDYENSHIKFSEGKNQLNNTWINFPLMREALCEHHPTDEGFCIATLPSDGIWGVGVDDTRDIRYHASLVALAISLVLKLSKEDRSLDLSHVSTFEALVTKCV